MDLKDLNKNHNLGQITHLMLATWSIKQDKKKTRYHKIHLQFVVFLSVTPFYFLLWLVKVQQWSALQYALQPLLQFVALQAQFTAMAMEGAATMEDPAEPLCTVETVGVAVEMEDPEEEG